MVDEGGAIKKLALRGIRSFSPDEESVSDSSRTTTREREGDVMRFTQGSKNSSFGVMSFVIGVGVVIVVTT